MPNLTAVAPVKPVPVIVTGIPPASGPDAGARPETVGPAVYVNRSADDVADVPPAVVTVTSTVPAEPGGEVVVIVLALTTVNGVAGVTPKVTAVAPVKPVPVIVTEVPPASGPAAGEMPLTVGAAVYV